MKLLVTGGAGFIGSNFIRWLLENTADVSVVNFDALTYAGNLENLADIASDSRYAFVKGDIADPEAVGRAFEAHRPDTVINFAAESHVDRSILGAGPFIRTNIMGTQTLVDAARKYGVKRYCQVSTDEVYGDLGPGDAPFVETTPIAPHNPYSASKAGADLLVLAAAHTHKVPAIITRCSNNYGPYHFPEKFIPLIICNAMEDKPLPLYGDGRNIRDWIHVRDHASGIWAAVTRGRDGEVYNFGCDNEQANIDIAKAVLKILGKPESLIKFVADRPGHDRRYAMGFAKAQRELGWKPAYTFESGLAATVRWYQDNRAWCAQVRSGAYKDYYDRQYANR